MRTGGLRSVLVLLLALAILPAALLLVRSDLQRRSAVARRTLDEVGRTARMAALRHVQLTRSTEQFLRMLSRLPEVRNADRGSCNRLFGELLEGRSAFLNLSLVGGNGDVVCSAVPFTGTVNVGDRGYVRRAFSSPGMSAGEFQIGRLTGQASLNFGYPVLGSAGHTEAIVVAALDLRSLSELGREALFDPGISVYLLDRAGVVLAAVPERPEAIGEPVARLARLDSAPVAGSFRAADAAGQPVFVGYAPAGSVVAMAMMPEERALAVANERLRLDLAAVVFVALLGFAAAWVVGGRMLVRPIEELVSAADRIGSGDLDVRVDESRRHELGLLARSFNRMAGLLSDWKVAAETHRHAILREREWLRVTLRDIPAGVALLDADGNRLIENPAGARFLTDLGLPGAEPVKAVGGHAMEALKESSATGNWTRVESSGHPKRAYELYAAVSDGGRDGRQVLVLRDVTEERELRHQLDRQERLAVMGQLAAGIAHDFNNILMGVLANAEVVNRSRAVPGELRKRIEAIIEITSRGARLIRQVLDFSRRAISARRPLDLGPLLADTVQLLRSALPAHVALRHEGCEPGYRVLADASRVEQMLTNLVVNARDAMPNGGVITVSLRPVPHRDARHRLWVALEVRDNGPGIAPDVADQVFEPYFTTKGPDRGTGLGLPQVAGIVQDHGGEIFMETHPGEGTLFTVYLPTIEAQAEAEQIEGDLSLPRGAGELILLAEDDDAVRDGLRAALELLGYRVLAASDGAEALVLFEENHGEVALGVFDLIMPRLGGRELVQRVRARRAGLPIVLITGSGGLDDGDPADVASLQKPFPLPLLARVVAERLGRR